jgi:hypothetical protein
MGNRILFRAHNQQAVAAYRFKGLRVSIDDLRVYPARKDGLREVNPEGGGDICA